MSKNNSPTSEQKEVIFSSEKNLLVSASAGTGKTTTMINRIVNLIENDMDVSEIVVVTFTNLAAAGMREKLAEKLSELHTPRALDQLEKLDSASICTLHSFCGELLRNYFYVVDIDPAFLILDEVTVGTLRRRALDDVFGEYFKAKDKLFDELYKILSTNRREENFRSAVLRLYDFGKCLPDFDAWYLDKKKNFVDMGAENLVPKTILDDLTLTLNHFSQNLVKLNENVCACYEDAQQLANDVSCDKQEKKLRLKDVSRLEKIRDVVGNVISLLQAVRTDGLNEFFVDIADCQMEKIPRVNGRCSEFEVKLHSDYNDLKNSVNTFVAKCNELCRGKTIEELWEEMQLTLPYVDKLVEVTDKFANAFAELKRQRSGLDFNDLEHLTLQLLMDEDASREICDRYKQIFVDEYQDTNPVQEEIVRRLSQGNALFMVGDVKQSIYSFRGCEPDIFVKKVERYEATGEGKVAQLQQNFRSNKQILNFVNKVFDKIMTKNFGNVDYTKAQLDGDLMPVFDQQVARPVCIDILKLPPSKTGDEKKVPVGSVYDIAIDNGNDENVSQGLRIAERIKQYLGMAYKDADGKAHTIGYNDMVILMRGMTDRAREIYNTLVKQGIPVAAQFKVEGYSDKEVRDVVNMLRVIDNPYNDIYMVGACLVFGKLSEDDLGCVRLDTRQSDSFEDRQTLFYDRLRSYVDSGADRALANKISVFLNMTEKLRFYAQSASVCEVVLELMRQSEYELYVRGMPNGELRLNKLYEFLDGIKDVTYAQSVDKFISYIDESDDKRPEELHTASDAVRIMTMHAAKGLDFPIVFLAGLETKFNFDSFSVEQNPTLGVAMNWYDFDSMRYASTLGKEACKLLNQNRQREEEMRLLYVAMTRARHVLNLVATVDDGRIDKLPVEPKHATSHFDWLHIALCGDYKDALKALSEGVEVQQYDAYVKTNPSEQSDENEESSEGSNGQQDENEIHSPDFENGKIEQISAEEVRERLRFRYAFQSQTEMPTKVVSSALDKEYIDLGQEEEIPDVVLNSDGNHNEVGTAYHKVYQFVDYSADVEQISDTLFRLVSDGVIEQWLADELDVSLIYNTLNNPDFVKLYQGCKVYREIPFMLYVPYNEVAKDGRYTDNVMLQGVIDMLAIKEGVATVVDFKYTAHPDKTEENYAKQLNSYRLAVERICGLTHVECYILSIADNKLIKM